MNYQELENFLLAKIDHAKIEIIGMSVLKRYLYSVLFHYH